MNDTPVLSISDTPAEPPEPPVPKFPKAIFFILGNELCERYAFYGMRSVLVLYLTQELRLGSASSKIIIHMFNALNYFIPLFGGLLADIYLGKFKTILYMSILYTTGNIFLSLITVPQVKLEPKMPLIIVALIIIATGAGGIKPCVPSFGGDQFVKGQEQMRDKFFSIFYFCINVGAALAMILSPIFRADVSCLGLVQCYPLAFGFPALLMVIAVILFLVGKPLYKIFPPNGTAVVDVVRCIWHAMLMKPKKTEKKAHWLDYAEDKYDQSYIQDVRTLLSILLLFVPIPMFWALFDQQGSTWTLQSTKLDGRVTETWEIKPDQMDSLNAILALVFIPIFTFFLYPLLSRCKLLRTPLQKISTGGFLTALAFLLGGFIQLSIEARLPGDLPAGTTELMVINTMNCKIDVNIEKNSASIGPYEHFYFRELSTFKKVKVLVTLSKKCKMMLKSQQTAAFEEFDLDLEEGKAYSAAVQMSKEAVMLDYQVQIRKRDPKAAKPFVRIIYTGQPPFDRATLLLEQEKMPSDSRELFQEMELTNASVFSNYASIHSLHPCKVCWALFETTKCKSKPKIRQKISVYKGGIFEFLLIPTKNYTEMILKKIETFPSDSLHMLIQTPMYVLITAGEVMLSIAGLTFAYSQAPLGMKAVLQAAWLLTISVGNIFVIIVVKIREEYFQDANESTYFFIFAGLMTVDMIIFSVLSCRYKYSTERVADINTTK